MRVLALRGPAFIDICIYIFTSIAGASANISEPSIDVYTSTLEESQETKEVKT
jgi:hypothetical protein